MKQPKITKEKQNEILKKVAKKTDQLYAQKLHAEEEGEAERFLEEELNK